MIETEIPIKINNDLCCKCAGCVAVCPGNAIHMDNLNLEIDMSKCNDCSICIIFCPVEALKYES